MLALRYAPRIASAFRVDFARYPIRLILAMLIGALMFRFPLTRERQQELRRQVDVRDAERPDGLN